MVGYGILFEQYGAGFVMEVESLSGTPRTEL
jgi:hypothetical protein